MFCDARSPEIVVRFLKIPSFIAISLVVALESLSAEENIFLRLFLLTDYTRHLEEIVRHTENVLMEIVQNCMLEDNKTEAIQILRMWETFSTLLSADTASKTMKEETEHFLKKLQKLEDIWKHLQHNIKLNSDIQTHLTDIQEKGRKILNAVTREGNLNAGGKFEWVDSVLIKCLQEGSWLLIDNVNLCSPAVLDRLNALLEPNGVLTIGERGVMANGEMIVIKPHKDFRLFLTMDPKNGEISRAMRNRGIEIYMLNENENLYDTKSLISQAGLKDNKYIEILLQIHNFITDMVLGEKPNLNQLLQASFLISQQLLRGKNVYKAFYYTIFDIYYKSRSPNKFNSNDPSNMIEQELQSLLNPSSGHKLEFYCEDMTLKSSNLSINSCMEKIKQQSVLARKYDTSNLNLLRNFFINFYNISNSKEFKYRHAYIISQSENATFKKLCEHIFKMILEYPAKTTVKGLPYDFHWLPDSVYRNDVIVNNSNKLYLLMYFSTTKLLKENIEENKATLLTFLNNVRSKKVECKIDDVLENDLLNLLDTFDQFILQTFKTQELNMSDEQVIEVVSILQWRYVLFKLTNTSIKQIELWKYKEMFTNLHVHYKWFFKFSIRKLMNVLNVKTSDKLAKITNRINSSTSSDFSLLRKISKNFQKNINRPPPLINKKQIEISSDYEKVLENFNLYNKQNNLEKILGVFCSDKKLWMLLIKTKMELNYELYESPESFTEVNELVNKYTNIQDLDSIQSNKFELLMVFDHLAKLALNKLKSGTTINVIEKNQNMLMESFTVPVRLLGIIERYNLTKDTRLMHEFKSEMFNYLLNTVSLASCKYYDIDDSNEKRLHSHFSPILSILISKLIISDFDDNHKEVLKISSFGDYRNTMDKHKMLNLLLWRNLLQISNKDYDSIFLELTYVRSSFYEFIQQLTHTLNVEQLGDNTDIITTAKNCIGKIEEIYKNSEIDDMHNDQGTLVLLLDHCIKEFEKLHSIDEINLSEKLHFISNLHYLLSYLRAFLNSKLPSIDPLVKMKLKKQYCLEEVEELSTLIQGYKMQNEIYSGSDKTLHSHIPVINNKIEQLKQRDIEFGKYVAVRPENITYTFIFKEILYHFSIFLQPKQVLKLFVNLNELFDTIQEALKMKTEIDLQLYEKSGKEILQYMYGSENLISIMQRYRHYYPDIVEPLLSNLMEFLYVLKLKMNLHNKLLMQYHNMKQEIHVNEDLIKIMRFPVICNEQTDYVNAIKVYTDQKMQNFLTKTAQFDNKYIHKRENFRLLKCGIQELFNISVIDGENCRMFDGKLFKEFDALLGVFVKAWKQQEEELELKRKEEESLYKMKPKSEDKEIEDDCNEMFPSFHDKDFADIQEHSLGDASEENLSSQYVGVITLEDVRFVSQMHTRLLHLFTKTEWLNPPKTIVECDFVTPLIEKCKLLKLLFNKFGDCLDYTMDAEMLNTLNVLVAVAQRFGSVRISDEQIADQNKMRYNFYKDARVEEMEMSMWKDSLNNAFDKMNEPIAKWWFYIYEVMQQFIKEDTFTVEELISTLQKFITQSNLAEFVNRLNLLMTFHCHATYLPHSNKTDVFINVLWNVHEYFKQFSSNVENKIKELRAPIEKKLKEYVKIVKWKDISYWAVKETLDKTHKTLHKFIREFQDILKQPVTLCLTSVNPQEKQIENVGIWDRPQRHTPKTYHYTMDPSTYMARLSLSKKIQDNNEAYTVKQESILIKSERYFYKSRMLCKETILGTKYPTLIQRLDGFVSEVIEASIRLQNLEVDKSQPKDKQRSQAKGILQQKRKALSDLFKELTRAGLSFRTGIIQSKLKDDGKQYLLKPIDLRAGFHHINYSRNDEKLLTIWDGCEMYYTKALSRLDNLDASLQSPAKDLGIQNVERCNGFSKHLMSLAYGQKSKLIESSRTLYYLRYYSNYLTALNEEANYIPISVYEDIKQFLKNTIVAMEQYKVIFYTCPNEVNFGSELCAVPVLESDNNDSFLNYKHDSLWKDCYVSILSIISVIKKLLLNLEKSQYGLPCANFSLMKPTQIPFSNVDSLINELNTISHKLTTITTIFKNIPAIRSAVWLNNEANRIKDVLTEYSSKTNTNLSSQNLEIFEKNTEKFLQKMLVIMQNIYKKYKQDENTPNENKETAAENDEETDLKSDHLKTLIINDLFEDLKILNMNDILESLHDLVVEFYKSDDISKSKMILSQILPVLEQIILLYEYFITQQTSAYRVTCKMSSVFTNIFIDLVTKGFCVPPEFEELDSEGQSQQSGGGFGLGDGEGEKDVSDRIESEDQLEDAQPAGKEKEKQDDKDCKEEEKGIEMSEDFDSKLQDVEKGEDENDDDDKSDNNEDLDEQMGETDQGTDQLDREIWGSDNEDENGDEEQSQKEEKGSKGEKEGQDELAAKEDSAQPQDGEQNKESKEKNKKDEEINELNDAEIDDKQIDPYHGNHPEYPEPEPMELPDDLELDEGAQDNEETQNEENPFDIDTMKEQMPPENESKEEQEDKKEETKEDEGKDSDVSDDELDIKETDESKMDTQDAEQELEENDEPNQNKDKKETAEKSEDDNAVNNEESEMDQTHTNENQLQAMEVDDVEASDKVQTNPSENQKPNQPNEEICQEDNPDKEGIGQSRMEESKTGHKGEASVQQEMPSNRQEEEKEEEMRRKPGESDSKRSLGDKTESVKKKLKTIDAQQNEPETEETEDDIKEDKAEMYQHIKEAKENDVQVLDVATKEQAEQQKEVPDLKENEEPQEEMESSDVLPENKDEEDVDVNETAKQKAEKIESENKKKSDKGQHPEGDVLEELQDVEVEGDIIETATVRRGGETTHYTQYSNLGDAVVPQLSVQQINQIRAEVEQQLSIWNEPPTSSEAEQAWEKISAVTSSLAQNLSEQLRLVLEPTQASRLKGDYRTGRRINMRKVIPYIASQFRKDKIWLRRTKPSKREYQIALAIDDSSSMSDNHSKELAFESVALISKALTLLESGQLSVLSFGETTEVLHKLTDTFTEKSGSKLLQKFQFAQKKTCIAKLVDFVTEMLLSAHSQSNALIAKLLIIVSDGRGIFSEGESYVQQAVRRAKLSNIFMVFVIIDNPENKDSILDIRMPLFKDGKLLGIKSYMDSFPFPFYIILRDINSLPNVLSDALRQWFEIVSNIDKQ
ncbi:hypothetical protein ILUMI_25999 [Ignelater luminosus]|uniref:VWFA domain-containing protein n=1 Tax=Ignelater luminosus TaxID=2038154 RepID=A0A8K0FZE1_IGNLU|nr:hypothetical protein ILUMI_25999 [Ignelater luminosus]